MVAVPKYSPSHPVRVVTSAALFDGHDAAINVMRRILQATGAEVIHLGHNRSASDVVDAAIQEDAQAIAVSSYQGGHNEYFRYMKDLLAERGASHIRIFGGGGGVIVPREIEALEDYGIEEGTLTVRGKKNKERLARVVGGVRAALEDWLVVINTEFASCGPTPVPRMLRSQTTIDCHFIEGERKMVRIPTHRTPTHPGEMLLEEFPIPLALTQRELAKAIHVPYQRINDLVNGRRGITPSTALRLAKYFEVSPPFWLNL